MSVLQTRRALLIAQCELQRLELAERAGELQQSPLGRVAAEMLARSDGERRFPLGRPLTWAAALAGLLLLRRPQQILTMLGWARTAVSFGSRAAVILRLLDGLRPRQRADENVKS
jgi:hypothetical protein